MPFLGENNVRFVSDFDCHCKWLLRKTESAIQRVQASSLTFRIRRVCCHSNQTHAPIANLPNNNQLGGTPHHSPKLHPGPCSSVGMKRGADTHTHSDGCHHNTFCLATPNVKCDKLPELVSFMEWMFPHSTTVLPHPLF